MNDDEFRQLEGRLEHHYDQGKLPHAPDRLRTTIENLAVGAGAAVPAHRRPRGGLSLLVGAVLVGLLGAASLQFLGAARLPGPGTTDQTEVFTVSQIIAARDAGDLGSRQVRLQGFWSDASFGHSCARPLAPPGELELYCHAGEYGITERNEPIARLIDDSRLVPSDGPSLSPWVPERLWPRLGGVRGPLPVIVIGHFDDPRAEDCQPTAVEVCRARFVIDDVL